MVCSIDDDDDDDADDDADNDDDTDDDADDDDADTACLPFDSRMHFSSITQS